VSSERRHRLNGPEVGPVREEIRKGLRRMLEDHNGSIYSAGMLLRVLIRLDDPHTGRYDYPPLTWDAVASYVNGSIEPFEAQMKERFAEVPA
jgi:hypothetical protein